MTNPTTEGAVTNPVPSKYEFKFHNIRDYRGSETYYYTNENLAFMRSLVEARGPFGKAGGICSSGDMFLFGFLPYCEGYVAVDHNWGSLRWAMAKVKLLYELPSAEILKYGQVGSLYDMIDQCALHIPKTVHDGWSSATTCYDLRNPKLLQFWQTLTIDQLDRVKAKLDQVTFVHGDLRDLAQFAPDGYDCVYLSNALNHTSHKGAWTSDNDLSGLFHPGSYVFRTENGGTVAYDPLWTNEVNGIRSTDDARWEYFVSRRAIKHARDSKRHLDVTSLMLRPTKALPKIVKQHIVNDYYGKGQHYVSILPVPLRELAQTAINSEILERKRLTELRQQRALGGVLR